MSWELASFVLLACALAAGFALVRALATRPSRDARARRDAGGAGGARARRVRAAAERQADDRHRAAGGLSRSAARRASSIGAVARAGVELLLRPGAVDAVADGRLGALRPDRGGARAGHAPAAAGGMPLAVACGVAGFVFGAIMDVSIWVDVRRAADARPVPRHRRGTSLPFNVAHAVGNVVFCLAFGPGAGARADALPRARDASRWLRAAAPATRSGAPARRWPSSPSVAVLAAGLAHRSARRRYGRRAALPRPHPGRRTPTATLAPTWSRDLRARRPVGPAAAAATRPRRWRAGAGVTVRHAGRRRRRSSTSAHRGGDPRCAARCSTSSRRLTRPPAGRRVLRATREPHAFGVIALRGAGAGARGERSAGPRLCCASRTPTAASTSPSRGGTERQRRHRRGDSGAARRRARPRRRDAPRWPWTRTADPDGGLRAPGRPVAREANSSRASRCRPCTRGRHERAARAAR